MAGEQDVLELNYRSTHEAMSRAQATYLADRTHENWIAYLRANEAHHPYMVAMNQRRMQAQIDGMKAEEFASFRRMIN